MTFYVIQFLKQRTNFKIICVKIPVCMELLIDVYNFIFVQTPWFVYKLAKVQLISLKTEKQNYNGTYNETLQWPLEKQRVIF